MKVRHAWIVASATSGAFVLLAALAMFVQAWLALSRFGSENLIGWIIALEVTRVWGACGAAMVACFHVTALQHGGASWSRQRIALVAACSVFVLYFPVSALALASTALLAKAAFSISLGTFFELLNAGDVVRGAVTALVLGVVPLAWTFVCGAIFASSTRRLGWKLFVTWLCVLALSVLVNVTSNLVPDSDSPSNRLGTEMPL